MKENNAYITAQLVVEQLVQQGIKHFCVSPGYRNSALLVALSKTKNIEIHSHVDERGAAFFALGLAKSTNNTVALICTSGTAVANYHPAILEAFYGHVPLLVITADRPQELLGVGANQSMNQINIFGGHVRFHAHIPALELQSRAVVENISHLAARCAHLTRENYSGPVHLNIAFREPFLPDKNDAAAAEVAPKISFHSAKPLPSHDSLNEIVRLIREKKKILLAIGQNFSQISSGNPDKFSQTISALAEKLDAPVFVEASSGAVKQNNFCFRFEHLLKNESLRPLLSPDLMIRFGSPLTSKAFLELHERSRAPIMIFDFIGETRNQNYGEATYVSGDPATWAKALLEGIEARSHVDTLAWKQKIIACNGTADDLLDKYLRAENKFTEWHFAQIFSQNIHAKEEVFLGNSMPIRDFDSVASVTESNITMHSNRALSGIDGIISTALGTCYASKKKMHLVIGDISFLHDLNALSLAKRLSPHVHCNIFVINNGGGEIFRIVPSGDIVGAEHLFTTPQELNFKFIAEGFGLSYKKIKNARELLDAMSSARAEKSGVRVYEVSPDLAINTNFRKQYWRSLKQ